MDEATKLVNNVDASNPTPPTTIFAKSLPDVSKIEVFTGQNFHPWQECVHTLLDMHVVVFALSTPKTIVMLMLVNFNNGFKPIRYAITLC